MSYIRITKEFRFEMAHALSGYQGPCSNIHGHSYELSVTIIGRPVTSKNDAKVGMVFDYSDLSKLINKLIVEPFDHSLVLNKNSFKRKIYKDAIEGKVKLLDFQPTCENLLIFFVNKIRKKLPTNVKLHHLKLRETATSFAEWYQEDNRNDDYLNPGEKVSVLLDSST